LILTSVIGLAGNPDPRLTDSAEHSNAPASFVFVGFDEKAVPWPSETVSQTEAPYTG